jgi:histidinol-phosphatase
MSRDLELALRLADEADAISIERFRARDLVIQRKPDLTPVTEVDRAVESALRRRISELRPDDAVLGEEEGETPGGDTSRRWILDPIDGTRNYARGVPVWATLIALQIDEVVQLGVVSAPALRRRWWAERGAGTHADGSQVRVSAVRHIEDAVICFALEQPVPSLAARAWHARGYGDFWAHMLVAEGAADGAIEAVGVGVWDLAPIQVIIEEAGGQFTDYAGAPRIDSGNAVSSNGHLHGELLAALA